jgi:3-deoxy-manno-octulosonate cytidylyltransferase (CMP-KDO synthetase)
MIQGGIATMIIIPARIGSTRFPSKVLANIHGIPMVVRTAKAVESIDDVAIATDAQEIVETARRYNILAVLTSTEHQSGTDRVYEAAQKLELNEQEVIINVQADEPFIESDVVQSVFELTRNHAKNRDVLMNSCYKKMTHPEADDPNLVKVALNHERFALYFSRAKIPYPRDHHFDAYHGHLGIYGFTMRSLETFCGLEVSPLERIEKLEQLRALYYGYQIAMTEVETESFGIDTPEDLERAIQHHTL